MELNDETNVRNSRGTSLFDTLRRTLVSPSSIRFAPRITAESGLRIGIAEKSDTSTAISIPIAKTDIADSWIALAV
jgi:hypothetical protein